MHNERDFINAITTGDDSQLEKLLQAHVGDDLLVATITGPRPTNHAIGLGMTLLQLASIRERKGGNPAQLLIDRGVEVDLRSACGLGLIVRIEELLADQPEGLNKQVDTYFALQFAIAAGRSEVIDCLAKYGDDANHDLGKVAYFGWEDDAREQNFTPWKPIHMASRWAFASRRVLIAQALASAGADLNALSPLDGFRPIHLVSMPRETPPKGLPLETCLPT